jgi:HK97 family phage portal protein
MRVVDPEGGSLPDHPARDLFARPNDELSEYDANEITLIQLMLAGNSFWQKVRSRGGLVVELWPIYHPHRMTPSVAKNGRLIGWEYQEEGLNGERYLIPKEDIVQYKYFHPLNPYMGLAPIAAATRAVYRDNQATDFISAFFQNAAVPQGLLKIKHRVQKDEAERVRALWRERYSGKRGWYEVAVLDADTEYQQLGLSQSEMGMPDLTNLNESRICAAFGVPPQLVGALVGLNNSTYSNYETGRRVFWEDTLSPLYTRLANVRNANLAPDFGLKVRHFPFRWDFSQVTALQTDDLPQREVGLREWELGLITRNEYRVQFGYERDRGVDFYRSDQAILPEPQTLEKIGQPGVVGFELMQFPEVKTWRR